MAAPEREPSAPLIIESDPSDVPGWVGALARDVEVVPVPWALEHGVGMGVVGRF